MQAVINLTGEGTKLRPLNCEKCGAMLKMTANTVIGENIRHLRKHNIKNILILARYMGKDLKKYLEKYEKNSVTVKILTEDLGDGALVECYDFLEEDFVYFSSDLYTVCDLTALIEYHREKDAFATVFLRCPEGGNLQGRSDGRITKVPEKRLWNSFGEDKNGTGIYVLKKDIVKYMPPHSHCDIKNNVLPSLIRSGKNVYVSFDKDWGESITDFASYMRANFLLLDSYKNIHHKGIFVEDGAVVEKGALLEGPCYVGSGAHIKKGASIGAYSIIQKHAIISEGANIKRSIIGEECKIGKNSALRGCIIDEKVVCGENSSVFEQAVIGKGCVIEKDCTIRSFVRIWPEKTIEKGMNVTENIMWGQKKRKRLFEKGEISGIVNSDITASFSLKLGECIGTVTDMGDVGVSCDGKSSSMMLRDSLISGLLSTGCSVKDFGEQPKAITRRAVGFYMLSCGVVISVTDKDGEDCAEISLIWKKGMDLDDATKKRMEDVFSNGDVVYTESKNIKECEYLFEYKLYYLKNILNKIAEKSGAGKVLISCPATWGRRLIASALSDLGYGVNMYSPPVSKSVSESEKFEKALKQEGFYLGFIIDSECENLTIVTPKHGVVEKEIYDAICAYIIMKKYPDKEVYIPLTASRIIEDAGKKEHRNVVRVADERKELLEKLSQGEKSCEEQYVLKFDAVGAIVKILDFISKENTTLDNIIDGFPKINMARAYVEMTKEEMEGAIERIKDIDGYYKSNPDGVKITFDKGWVLVMEDKYRDLCSVISEGVSAETARELCDFCVEKLMGE
ncbi:MAG: sugar phosphate nucleotidyltransferase [Clostridia bacterium]